MNRLGIALLLLCCVVSVAQSTRKVPHARLSNYTIELEPFNATFTIPQNWVELYHEEGFNNLYLTRDQLDKVREAGETEWDADYARIVDAVLAFEHCAVHAGGDGWGKDSRLYNDLQMRVYVGTWAVATIEKLIKEQAVPVAKEIAKQSREKQKLATEGGLPMELSEEVFEQKLVGKWRKSKIALPLWYHDYGGTGNIEFYVRSFTGETVTLVFMYASGASQAKSIPEIVASFKHPLERR